MSPSSSVTFEVPSFDSYHSPLLPTRLFGVTVLARFVGPMPTVAGRPLVVGHPLSWTFHDPVSRVVLAALREGPARAYRPVEPFELTGTGISRGQMRVALKELGEVVEALVEPFAAATRGPQVGEPADALRRLLPTVFGREELEALRAGFPDLFTWLS